MRGSAGLLVLVCAVVLIAAGCGRKRPPPLVSPPPAAKSATRDIPRVTPLPPQGKVPSVRVLLRENFGSVRIDGSTVAPSVRVQADGNKIMLADSRGTQSGSGFRLDPGQDGLFRLDGRLYRGALEAFINPLGIAVLVNELNLEDYLKGVVANEINPVVFPHPEAIKAQAIAARSFALAGLAQFAARGFDLYSDDRSQVYQGAGSELALSNQAVDETRGLAAVYQGRPIVAFYSSTCGGRTEDYQLVFQRDPIPYLRGGVECEDDSGRYSSWEETVPASRIQENLDRMAKVGRLKKLVVLKRGASGRIVEMRFAGDQGETVLKGNNVRAVLGLRSSLIVDLKTSYDSSGYVRDLQVKGKGYGHGVGLCQIGAIELAKRGVTFEKILKRYYPGVEVVQMY